MSITIEHNPFATAFTRPGQIPFLLGDGEDLAAIADSFRDHRFVGQIVGPHGCGKTTLTHALEPLLSEEFRLVRRVTIRDSRHVQTREFESNDNTDSKNSRLLIVDGLERLPWLHRKLLLKQIRFPNTGLLITTHRAFDGIPVLYEVRPTLETLRRLTELLAPGLIIGNDVLALAYEQNRENIRECLMTLYDWFEAQKSAAGRTV